MTEMYFNAEEANTYDFATDLRGCKRVIPRVLIVDDESSVSALYRIVFESAGYSVSETSTVAETLAIVTSHPFDIMVVDASLPDGDGLTLLKSLRPQGIPAILTSGDTTPFLTAAAKEIGARAVHKLDGVGHLLDVARSLLGNPS